MLKRINSQFLDKSKQSSKIVYYGLKICGSKSSRPRRDSNPGPPDSKKAPRVDRHQPVHHAANSHKPGRRQILKVVQLEES